jgi:hypothetical protein
LIGVIVDNRVRIRKAELPSDATTKLIGEFTHKNPKRMAMEAAGIRGFWAEPRIISTWSEDDEFVTFPRGGLARIRRVLRDYELEFATVDRRENAGGPTSRTLECPRGRTRTGSWTRSSARRTA